MSKTSFIYYCANCFKPKNYLYLDLVNGKKVCSKCATYAIRSDIRTIDDYRLDD